MDVTYERWAIEVKIPGFRFKPKPWAGEWFYTRAEARKVCREIKQNTFRFQPKSKGGLGYPCKVVKVKIRWQS